VLVATCLTATGFAPLAHAQDKPAAKKAAAAKADAEPAGGAAAAKPDKKTRDQARKAYTDGEKSFNKGDYEKALANFKQAHGLIPTPHAEYWVAASHDKLNQSNEAIAAYEQFLANPDAAKVGEEKLTQAKTRLESLKASLMGEVNLVTTPPGATVNVDGEPQGRVTPLSLKLPPGAHKVAFTLPGYETKEVEVNVVTGEKSEQKVELAAEQAEVPPAPVAPPEPTPAAPTEEPAPPPEPRSKVPAYVTLGVAGAGAVVGTIFGLKALSAKSDYDDAPSSDGADDVERNALIADMAFGVAITLGVTGVVLLTSSDSSAPGADTAKRVLRPRHAKLNVAPYVNQYGGGAAARLRF
jgi:hypothetical protein